jgi:TPR repeat protein
MVPRDEQKALAYLRQAAAQDFMRSRELLALYEVH